MTTFDGSTGGGWPEADGDRSPDRPGAHTLLDDHAADADVDDGFDDESASIDTLELVRSAVESRPEIEPEIVPVPHVPLRLVCSTVIDGKQVTRWQQKALPPKFRRMPNPPMLMLDQTGFTITVLTETCERIEVRRADGKGWRTVVDGNGEILRLGDRAFMDSLGTLDVTSTVKKMFGRDSDIQKAGRQVLDAAGWSEDRLMGSDGLDDDEDPTG